MKSKRKRIPYIKPKIMPQETFVVLNPVNDLYLIGYNQFDPPSSIFGNLENAIEFETLGAAEQAAAAIGGGTVGTTKPH